MKKKRERERRMQKKTGEMRYKGQNKLRKIRKKNGRQIKTH